MKNIEQFLLLGIYNNIISEEEKIELFNLFNSKFPNSDLYKHNLSATLIDKVLTFSEASTLYNLSNSTLNKNIEYDSYIEGEIKKSGKVWLITLSAMERIYPNRRLPIHAINYLSSANEIVNDDKITKLINLLKLEYPNMDVYNESTINNFIPGNRTDNCIEEVLTFSEAAEMYNIYKTTLRKNVDYGRYEKGEVRQSQGVWLITLDALERLYGNGEKNR